MIHAGRSDYYLFGPKRHAVGDILEFLDFVFYGFQF